MACPLDNSKYMGEGSRAQIPLRITPEYISAATHVLDNARRNSGYQAEKQYLAARRWIEGLRRGEKVWLGVSGAATPVGFGGLIADLIERGLVDVITTTGANAYHDLHFACGLPVRHGNEKVDDNDLFMDETTRIYTQYIHNRYTLKTQDMINEIVFRRVLDKKRLTQPFSTAMMLYEFGRELAESEFVRDREGSFVLKAAEHGVPIFLDSASNHSLGMDFSLLHLEGYKVDSSPSRDIIQAAALSMHCQPQLNVFLGEGGPRNFTQTTAPTAAEIFAIPFQGSSGCIRFTTAIQETGSLSGSTGSEAKTWGKYPDADPSRDIVVWNEYTTTFSDVAAYVAGKVGERKPLRIMERLSEIEKGLLEKIEQHKPDLAELQKDLMAVLPAIQDNEMRLRNIASQ